MESTLQVITPSKRVLQTIYKIGWLNVWEGAVRSSKTLTSSMAWLYYLSTSDDTYFLMTGRSIGSLMRNVWEGEMGIKKMVPGAYLRSGHTAMTIMIPTPKGMKVCYCFGGANANSHESLVGVTVSGWYADEISEHHPRFIEECFNRTVVSRDRKHFWTLNPQTPKHFIYTDYLDKFDAWTPEERERAGGYYWWHFTLEDNPALTPKAVEMLKMQYSGYAYKRYILGLRVVAEGLVYGDLGNIAFKHLDPIDYDCRYASIDFGTTHATVFHIGGPLIVKENGHPVINGKNYKVHKDKWAICYEYFDQGSGKDTGDYVKDFEALCARNGLNARRMMIAIDPAAGPLKNSFRKAGYAVFDAKNDVLSGILYVQRYLKNGIMVFNDTCKALEIQMGTYHWDEKATERGEDKVIKADDDAVDSMRYFVMSHVRLLAG